VVLVSGNLEMAAWNPLTDRVLSPPPHGERLSRAWADRDAFSARMLAGALQEMGAFRRTGEEHSIRSLMAELGVVPAHRHLWAALLDIATTAGLIERDGEVVRAAAPIDDLPYHDLTAEYDHLVEKFPEVTGQIELLKACVEEYPQLLRGEIAPIQVLFPGASMDKVEAVYRGDPVSDHLNELVAHAVAAYTDRVTGAPVRILEVGAGTGGTTAEILAMLARYGTRVAYVYTDISPGFLRHGRRRFRASYPATEFKLLDIEGDMAGQGFAEGEFDVVVAANALHATRSLGPTLANVAYLLGDSGQLVLRELTACHSWISMTFGLFEAWWRSEDGYLRLAGSPLADVPTWGRLLREAGFPRTAVLGTASDPGVELGQHVLVGER
jgi:SAM-dependent methyltransferase